VTEQGGVGGWVWWIEEGGGGREAGQTCAVQCQYGALSRRHSSRLGAVREEGIANNEDT